MAPHSSGVLLCTFFVLLSDRVLRVSSFTVLNHLSLRSTAINIPTHEQLFHVKTGGRVPDIRKTVHRATMSQAGDLSEEDQSRSKKLADAWIRQDKASECSKLLQVRFKTFVLLGLE